MPNDTLVEELDELDEFAACVRGEAQPEVDGALATASLAVIHAGIQSVRERRWVEVAELLEP